MLERKTNLVEVSMEGLHHPMKIGVKARTEGDNTITRITVHAKIENKFEEQFEENILRIVNNTREYTGPQQLSSNLII